MSTIILQQSQNLPIIERRCSSAIALATATKYQEVISVYGPSIIIVASAHLDRRECVRTIDPLIASPVPRPMFVHVRKCRPTCASHRVSSAVA